MSFDSGWDSLPLFAAPYETQAARRFHERNAQQKAVIGALRAGKKLTKRDWESCAADGSRLAPAVEQLRNAYGFVVDGDGSVGDPYFLRDVRQQPSLACVTPEMKAAYYTTQHWQLIRQSRLSRDGWSCVLCGGGERLVCHHVTYERLFGEHVSDLLTLCMSCHDLVHENCRLKFPSGVSVQYAHWLGWKGFEEWLLP